MEGMRITRPGPSEFAPYYERYVSLVNDGDIVETLTRQQPSTVAAFVRAGGVAPSPGKWSVKEVLGHVIDTERIMAYRALRIGRGDATPLPGFDQDPYIEHAGFEQRSLDDLLDEYNTVRAATLSLLAGFEEAAWGRFGSADGKAVSVRALAWIIAGHELHHVKALGGAAA